MDCQYTTLSDVTSQAFSWTTIGVSLFASIAMGYLLYRVVKIVKTKDPTLVLMLGFVTLSFVSYAAAQYFIIYLNYMCDIVPQLCKIHGLGNLSTWAQCIAILLNLQRWQKFQIKLKQLKGQDVGSNLLAVNVVTCLVALVFTGLMLYTTPLTWCRVIPTQ